MNAKELDGANNPSSVTALPAAATRTQTARKAIPPLLGLATVVLLGLVSYWIAGWLSSSFKISLDAVIIALILGMAIKNLLPRTTTSIKGVTPPETVLPPGTVITAPDATMEATQTLADKPTVSNFARYISGAQLGTKFLIPAAIILYGANLDISRLAALPWQVILITLLGMGLFYLLIYWLNPVLWKMPGRLNELIATGSAICGASAIVVVSPSIDAEPEETSTSLLAITAVGLLALMLYPIFRAMFGLSDELYALMSGATLHQTGLVRAAVTQAKPALDQSIVAYALAVKTLRIVMLAPVAIISGFLHLRVKKDSDKTTKDQKRPSWTSAVLRVWFLGPFIILGLLTSFIPEVRTFMADLKPLESIVFASALASIGFDIDIESVILSGMKPVLVALLAWLGVMLFFVFTAPLFIV